MPYSQGFELVTVSPRVADLIRSTNTKRAGLCRRCSINRKFVNDIFTVSKVHEDYANTQPIEGAIM